MKNQVMQPISEVIMIEEDDEEGPTLYHVLLEKIFKKEGKKIRWKGMDEVSGCRKA